MHIISSCLITRDNWIFPLVLACLGLANCCWNTFSCKIIVSFTVSCFRKVRFAVYLLMVLSYLILKKSIQFQSLVYFSIVLSRRSLVQCSWCCRCDYTLDLWQIINDYGNWPLATLQLTDELSQLAYKHTSLDRSAGGPVTTVVV